MRTGLPRVIVPWDGRTSLDFPLYTFFFSLLSSTLVLSPLLLTTHTQIQFITTKCHHVCRSNPPQLKLRAPQLVGETPPNPPGNAGSQEPPHPAGYQRGPVYIPEIKLENAGNGMTNAPPELSSLPARNWIASVLPIA